MSDYMVFDKKWNEIDPQDWPEVGEIYICLDPQKRLGEETWIVSIMGDGTSEGDTVELGLFWKIEHAKLFADALTSTKWERDSRPITIPADKILNAIDKAVQSIIVEYMEVEQRAKQIEP